MQDVRMSRLDGYLTGPELESVMHEVGYLAEAMYQAYAPRRTGQLAASTVVDVEVGQPYAKAAPRWVAVLSVEAPYAAAVEFGHNLRGGGRSTPQHILRQVLQNL